MKLKVLYSNKVFNLCKPPKNVKTEAHNCTNLGGFIGAIWVKYHNFCFKSSGPSSPTVSHPDLQVSLPGVLQVLHGAAVGLLQTLLPPLVLRLQLVQLHPQVLPLLAELVLQLLQRRLRLGQLHLQTLLQQGDLEWEEELTSHWISALEHLRLLPQHHGAQAVSWNQHLYAEQKA